MADITDSSVQFRPSSLLARAAAELQAGNVASALEMYSRAGGRPSNEQMTAAADLLLDRGKISYALRLYQRARAVPDRKKLLAAAARQQSEGMIYPEIYDFLMATS
jgi:tetratricopeptide (TPR) repeat protein